MQIYDIKVDSQNQELTTHGDEAFPCAYYDEVFSRFLNREVPWHWHDEIEVVLVVRGTTKLECIGQSTTLHQGEMVLINSGVLHHFTDVGSEDCRILNVIFKPRLLGGDPVNLLHKKYIKPLVTNRSFLFYKFTVNHNWHTEAIAVLRKSFADWESSQIGFEITMTASLMQCWMLLCRNEPQLLIKSKKKQGNERRVQNVMEYIQKHYAEPISVADISAAANISESECYRMFKQALKCTPNGFLLSYRLRNAAVMLSESQSKITEIAQNVGFNCPAYFAKKFRQSYGVNPKQYRTQSELVANNQRRQIYAVMGLK
ncbi:AraC family transcriptional regulator [Photobacterium kishitanii]|uniref:AraC family transcriptional regulator n=1 Tax=Photobacterium kishitanii TaxID=318456 RepID=UPI000435DCB6|nr:AraC family transcriptional regulator [Photobacterium kishitanii]CEO37641.1 conserved hypothetical protein [Photobacterium kishitanii]